MASRLKLARAQLVSAEQRWNGLVERHEFYEELAGERDDNRGGGDNDDGEGEGEVGGRGGGKQIYPPSPDPGTKKVGEKRYIKEFYIIYI